MCTEGTPAGGDSSDSGEFGGEQRGIGVFVVECDDTDPVGNIPGIAIDCKPQVKQTVDQFAVQSLFMRLDFVKPDLLKDVDRFSKADDARVVRTTSL